MKRKCLRTALPYAALSALIVIVDQYIKACVRNLPLGVAAFSIPGVLDITHCVNTGAAFSVLSGNTMLIALLSTLLLALTAVFFIRMPLQRDGKCALAVLFGGGIGNLLDRLLDCGVIDYIRLTMFDFPVFNFADICITVSVFYLAIVLLKTPESSM